MVTLYLYCWSFISRQLAIVGVVDVDISYEANDPGRYPFCPEAEENELLSTYQESRIYQVIAENVSFCLLFVLFFSIKLVG